MKGMFVLLGAVMVASFTTSATAANCDQGYTQTKPIASNATISTRPRATGVNPVFNYVKPTISTEIGNSPVTNSLPAAAWQRFFKAVIGGPTKAVALTIKMNESSELPLLIVTRDGNTANQALALSRSSVPALVVPKTSARFVVSMKMSETYDSHLAPAFTTALGVVGPLVGGVPALLASPAAAPAAKVMDGLLDATFTTMSNHVWEMDLPVDDLKAYDCIRFSIYDGAHNAAGTQLIVQTSIHLKVERTIIADSPTDNQRIKWPTAQKILSASIGGRSVREILQQKGMGEKLGGLAENKDTKYYKEGCKDLRVAIENMGFNEADSYAVLYAALSSIQPTAAALKECPDAAERKAMAELDLPSIAAEGPWETLYKNFMTNEVLSAFRATRSFDGLFDPEEIRVRQDLPILKDFPVDANGRELNERDATALFKASPAQAFGNFEYRGSSVAIVKTLTIGGKKCQARIVLSALTNDDWTQSARIREIRLTDILY